MKKHVGNLLYKASEKVELELLDVVESRNEAWNPKRGIEVKSQTLLSP